MALAFGIGMVEIRALVGAGFLDTGASIPVPVAHAETNLNDGWVNGDQSGSLVGLDPGGKVTQAFPLKKTDGSIQVSGPLARAQVTQQFENLYSYAECTREHRHPL